MTFLSMTDEKDAWWRLYSPGIFFLSASKSPFVCNGKRSLPINFYMAMLWWLYSPNGDLPLCMRQNLRLRLSWSFSYNEAFCLRMDLVCSIAIVVGCSCLPSSTNRSSLRSRFSFCLSLSICSCDHPPCRKVYCLLVYHCLWRHTPWKRALHWWWLLQMIEPYDAVTVFLRPFLNYRFFEATIFPMQR